MSSMTKTAFTLVLGLAMGATAASAQVYRAENRVQVAPAGGSSFVVRGGGGWGAQGTWCAASDYARNVLGAGNTTRIFVDNQPNLANRHVKFTLSQGNLTRTSPGSISAALRSPGASISVGGAYQYCVDIREFFNNR